MLTIKISDEMQANLKLNSVSEALATLENSIVITRQLADAQQEKESMAEENAALLGRITALETSVKDLSAKLDANKSPDAEAFKAQLKIIAAQEVSAAIAKVGGQAFLTKEPPKDAADHGEPKIAGDDYAAQWDASKSIQAEFPTKKGYELFMKAQSEGRIHFNIKPQA